MSEAYVAVPEARLFTRTVGDGAPLIVLHGGPDFDHTYLLPELDRLADAARLVYYDQRGRGRSAAGVAPESVTIASEIDDLECLRRHFGLETLALLGHSWGCLLALEYATRHPERTSRMILLNAAPASHADRDRFRAARESGEPDALAAMRAIAATAAYRAGNVAAEAAYYRAHFRRTLRPEQLDAIVGRLRVHFRPADILQARAIESRLYAETWEGPEYDLTRRLATNPRPMLVLHGDRDLIPLACARSVADASPGARLVVLEDCGHFAYLDQPERMRAEIERFLPH